MAKLFNFKDKNGTSLTMDATSENLVKDIANEYILFLSIDWFLKKTNQYSSFTNGVVRNFESSKLIFYPLFFTTANGSSNELFEIFKPFRKLEFGFYSENILSRLFTDSKFTYFELDKDNFDLKVKSNIAFKDISELLANEIIIKSTGEISEVKFSDIFIKKNDEEKYSSIIDALQSSKRALEFGTNNNFLNYDINDFKAKAERYKVSEKKELIFQ